MFCSKGPNILGLGVNGIKLAIIAAYRGSKGKLEWQTADITSNVTLHTKININGLFVPKKCLRACVRVCVFVCVCARYCSKFVFQSWEQILHIKSSFRLASNAWVVSSKRLKKKVTHMKANNESNVCDHCDKSNWNGILKTMHIWPDGAYLFNKCCLVPDQEIKSASRTFWHPRHILSPKPVQIMQPLNVLDLSCVCTCECGLCVCMYVRSLCACAVYKLRI